VSLDRKAAPELERPIGSEADLVAFLAAGEKPRSRFRVGTEHEKIGLYADTFTSVPYDGERGIGRILERIAELDGWTPIFESEALVALEKDAANITLEPGGQIELSGAPLASIHETCDEFHTHLDVVKRASEPLGIVWVGLGMHPLTGIDDVPHMPKERYRIMRDYLPSRGRLALHMMHLTATVQANFDFSDEADMVSQMRTAMAVTPIVSAIFANSSRAQGKPSGFASRRLDIWTETDPDRCGLLHFVFDEDFGYRRYVEWALDVPLFFIVRDGVYLQTRGLSFRRFLAEGFQGHRALVRDFSMHLTTLFPEVRLKQVVEVRGADAVPAELTCSLPALWKGLLYDLQAREAAFALVADWGAAQREEALRQAARLGLAGRVPGPRGDRKLLDLARELENLASEGLRRIGTAGTRDPDERPYLEPVREQLATGRSPGQIVEERWEGEWGRSLDRLIEYARY
jgi:glutamate--cysteine ligase